MKTTTIKYKCSCMQDEGSFTMRARGDTELLEDFMPRMQIALGRDHSTRNPLCRATKVEYAMMNAPDGMPIGSAT